MPQCAVTTCRNAYHRTRGKVCYHRFPQEEDVRDKWIKIIGCNDSKKPLNLTSARVCSLHFSPACYDRDITHELFGLPERKRLRKGAVPDRHIPKQPSQRGKNRSNPSTGSRTNSGGRKTAVSRRKPKFDSDIYIDITSFGKIINKVIVPEITVDVSQLTNNSFGVLIALGLHPNPERYRLSKYAEVT